MDGSDWNTDTSLFDQVQNPNLLTEDNIFNLNIDSSNLPLFADNSESCGDGYQPLSRLRTRAGGYCAQNGDHQDGFVPGDDQLGREAALTQEKINQENCPADYYQGIFLIPVCSLYDTVMIRPSRGQDGQPIPETGLQDVYGTLSKPMVFIELSALPLSDIRDKFSWLTRKNKLVTPVTEAFSPCFPKRRWCCQNWLPRQSEVSVSLLLFSSESSYKLNTFLQLTLKYGNGIWCVQGPAAKFLNPVDLFPPLNY